MALPDIKVEGVTTFYPSSTTYRYTLQLKGDRLSIWMEEKTSKKQWCKNDMDKADYLTSANTITDASALDYLECFQEVLECDLDKCDEAQRWLRFKQDGALQLSVSVEFRLLSSRRIAQYTFELEPVSVERICVLESKLQDLQEEMDQLRKDFSAGRALPFAQFEASTKDEYSCELLWKSVQSDPNVFEVVGGNVLFKKPGLYAVVAVVTTCSSGKEDRIALMKNDEDAQVVVCPKRDNHSYSATLSSFMKIYGEDELTVECYGDVTENCYLSIAQLGP